MVYQFEYFYYFSFLKGGSMNTRIGYTYRDASNYKASGSEVVKGIVKNSDLTKMEYFIPFEVGLQELQKQLTIYNGGNYTEDDHVYHELDDCESTEDKPTLEMTAEEFIKKFNNAPCNELAEMERLGL